MVLPCTAETLNFASILKPCLFDLFSPLKRHIPTSPEPVQTPHSNDYLSIISTLNSKRELTALLQNMLVNNFVHAHRLEIRTVLIWEGDCLRVVIRCITPSSSRLPGFRDSAKSFLCKCYQKHESRITFSHHRSSYHRPKTPHPHFVSILEGRRSSHPHNAMFADELAVSTGFFSFLCTV